MRHNGVSNTAGLRQTEFNTSHLAPHQRRNVDGSYIRRIEHTIFAACLTHLVLATLLLAPVSAARHQSKLAPEGEVDRWITRMFEPRPITEATEEASETPLCYAGPADLNNQIRGQVKVGGAPLGEPFTAVQIGKFPYASEHHCDEVSEAIKFIPDNCKLTSFEPTAFLRQITGRRLIFWGDSVTRQFFSYLSLRLHKYAPLSLFKHPHTTTNNTETRWCGS